MSNNKSDLKHIHNALQILKKEIQKPNQLIHLLRELMHEERVLILCKQKGI